MFNKMFVGTPSPESILSSIRKKDGFESHPELSDEQVLEKINNGEIYSPFTVWFDKNTSTAKTSAKRWGLKNFKPVSDTYYEKGVDY